MSSTTRILVVDDSAVVRGMMSKIIASEPGLELVGTAANGAIGLEKAARLDPDVIVLDIEMPVMTGLEAVVELRRIHPQTPIIMFSTLTERGAATTLDALSKGATDYAPKPTNAGTSTSAVDQIRSELISKIRELGDRQRSVARSRPPQPVRLTRPSSSHLGIKAVLIGSSTGGPAALETVLSAIPSPLTVPILVVQHMPPKFTNALAGRLDERCSFPVCEGEEGMSIDAGSCYIAPGGTHMTVASGAVGVAVLRLTDGPKVKSCRPSVDVLFDSARELYGGSLRATVLTGMGDDGLDSCRRLVDAGAEIVVQDEATSVVWGMPGAIAKAGIAGKCLPLDDIARAIIDGVVRPARAATHRPAPAATVATSGPKPSTASRWSR